MSEAHPGIIVADAIRDTDPLFDSPSEAVMTALAAAGFSVVPTEALNGLLKVATFVSAGRGHVGTEPYPDATARFALGALPDDLLDLVRKDDQP